MRSMRAIPLDHHASLTSSLAQLCQNLSAVGHCVSVLVAAVQCWEARKVRRTALLVLLALSGLGEETTAVFTGEGTLSLSL